MRAPEHVAELLGALDRIAEADFVAESNQDLIDKLRQYADAARTACRRRLRDDDLRTLACLLDERLRTRGGDQVDALHQALRVAVDDEGWAIAPVIEAVIVDDYDREPF